MRKLFGQDFKTATRRAFALFTAGFGLIAPLTYRLAEEQQLPIFLALMLAYTFLAQPALTRRTGNRIVAFLDSALVILSLATGLYASLNWEALVWRGGIPTTADVILGVIAIVLVLEATRRSVGLPLLLIVVVFIAYAFAGPLLPGIVSHKGYGIVRLVNQMYVTRQGMFGLPVSVIVRYVILFVILGNLLEASGGATFLINLARALAGRFTGGMGLVATVASGLVGTISGSAVANVVTTGTLTIPAMKKSGYEPHVAGAIEAIASTGGQLMPPVMGAAAFLMADVLGIPYRAVCAAALIPAILYYLTTWSAIYFYAARSGLKGETRDNLPPVFSVLKKEGQFVVPLLVVTVLLVLGYSPITSGLYGLISAYIVSLLRKGTRLGPSAIVRVFISAGESMGMLTVASAAAGMVIGLVNLTGIGGKLSGLLVDIAGGRMLVLLVLTMVVSIIMGMGMPTTAVYAILATLVVPGIVNLSGVPITAHLFVFYFGLLSMITPPVAMAAYAAAGIAKCSADKVGWTAMRIALPVFIVPYFMVYNPALALAGPLPNVLRSAVMAGLGVVVFSAGTMGYLFKSLSWWQRILLVGAGLALIDERLVTDVIGLAIVMSVSITQYCFRRCQS